jgi:hypothetical protein
MHGERFSERPSSLENNIMGDYGVFYAPTLFSLAAAWIAFRLLPDKWQFSENLGLDYSTYSNGLEVEHPYMLATRKARLSRAKSHGDGDGWQGTEYPAITSRSPNPALRPLDVIESRGTVERRLI